jgi:hypothetical protein
VKAGHRARPRCSQRMQAPGKPFPAESRLAFGEHQVYKGPAPNSTIEIPVIKSRPGPFRTRRLHAAGKALMDEVKEAFTMSRLVKHLPWIFLALFVLGISLPAAAQDVPLVEVSGGFNYLKGTVPVFSGRDIAPKSSRSQSLASGLYADLAITTPKPKKMLSLVVQISMNPKKEQGFDATQRGFMAGVRLNSRAMQRTVVFVQLLGGDMNSKFGNVHATTGGFDEWTGFFTVQVGGGVTMMATPKVGIRVGADLLQIHGKHDSTILNKGFNEVRVSGGVVLPYGKR